MNLLYQSAFIEALGWSLVDSLWQTGALWVVYVLLTGNGKKFSSSTRYLFGAAALGLSGTWFIVNLIGDYQALSHGRVVHSVSLYFKQHLSDVFPAAGFLDASIPFLSAAYLSVLAFCSARFLVAFVKSRSMLRSELFVADDHILNILENLSARIGIRKKINIWFSGNISSALTLGFLKPVILLPVAALNQLSISQTEAIIAHELFHIRRNDYFVNILLSVAELVLFFNPFARVLQAIIRKERENSCDDAVLALGYSSWEYSESLYLLGTSSQLQNKFALSFSGNSRHLLLDRIKRMLNCRQASVSIWKPFCLFLFFLVVAMFGKRKAELQNDPAKSSASPATFAYTKAVVSEKPVVIFETHIEFHNNQQKHPVRIHEKGIRMKLSIARQAGPPPQPPSPPVLPEKKDTRDDAVTVQTENHINHTFVSGEKQQLEFSIIEIRPVVPEVPNAGKLMPYVPASTFYLPDAKNVTPPQGAKKLVNI